LHPVELPQPLVLGPLSREQLVALRLDRTAIGDVDHVALPVADLPVVVAYRHRSVADPDDSPVPRDEPELRFEREILRPAPTHALEDEVAVVRVEATGEHAVAGEPIFARVPDEVLEQEAHVADHTSTL